MTAASPATGAIRLMVAIGAALALLATLLPAAAPAQTVVGTGDARSFEANIKRTEFGIPHITADDFGGIGFGYGYAHARDNICTLADTYLTVRAERSRYFGPSAGYAQRGNGFNVSSNLNSDFFYQRIKDEGIIENLLAQPSPTGPDEGIVDGVRGYVAGYNKYIADTGVDNIPDTRCRGEDWVKPIDEIDAYRRFYQLALLASQTIAIDAIGSAQPPASLPAARAQSPAQAQSRSEQSPVDPEKTAEGLKQNLEFPIGSNAYGIGDDATRDGSGIVLGNPHFPWNGSERLWESHLTIPGEVNVAGGALLGVPIVLIGHTDNLAWSHTVSTAYRFTPFEETLNPADPTQYLYDGQWLDMEQDTMTVKSLESGQLVDRTRTLYRTHHGSIFTGLAGIPLPWTTGKAFTMGDANETNFRYLNHFFFTNKAQSVAEYDQIQKTYQGIPWVTSTAADSTGKAYFADIGAVPNVSDAKAASCNTAVGDAAFAALRLPVLNGSLSACEWDTDADAPAPGIFGYENMPKLFRDDYVTNSNDSFWLSNPEEPLEGYADIIGDENTARSPRTRIGIIQLQDRFTAGQDQPAPLAQAVDRQDVQDFVFSNRQYLGELWRDSVVQMCENAPGGFLLGSGGPVDVSDACPVLDNWDLKENLNSAGAILFRRFATRARSFDGQAGLPVGIPTGDPSAAFAEPFNPADPVNTPSGLNIANLSIQASLADAVRDMTTAGTPLDRTIGQHQREKGIPIHGGPGGLGNFNAINVSTSAATQNSIGHGSSFVMVSQLIPGECPDSRMLVTYSQSEDPSSPHYKDQTQLYSNKQWVDPPFCADELAAAPLLSDTDISGCAIEGCPLDTDDDGVPDDIDECPGEVGPPSNNGCPVVTPEDSDGDGVNDDVDGCPAVPGPVSNNGCPLDGGGPGRPPVLPGRCANTLTGTPGGDFLKGSSRGDRIFGLAGNDRIRGYRGADCLWGQRGADNIHGGGGHDQIRSSAGRDVIWGGWGRDRIWAGLGPDLIYARDGARDHINCGPGRDRAIVDRRDATFGCEIVKRARPKRR